MAQVRKLWWLLDMLDVTLHPRYIRSAANVWADSLSRLPPRDEWWVSRWVFTRLDKAWGPHTVDRFSSACNAQVPRFNGAWGEEAAEGVDAFAQPASHWCQEINWCVPPVGLLPQLVQFLRVSGAAATVVAPDWPAQSWAQELRELASEVVVIPAREGPLLAAQAPVSERTGPGQWSVTCYRIPARQVTTGAEWPVVSHP